MRATVYTTDPLPAEVEAAIRGAGFDVLPHVEPHRKEGLPSGHCMSAFLSEVIEMDLGKGPDDLLGTETDEVHGGGEFPNLLRLRGALESHGFTGPGGDVAESFLQGLLAGLHLGSPLSHRPEPSAPSKDTTVEAGRCERCGNGGAR